MTDVKNLVNSIIPKLNFKFPYDVDDYCKNFYFENYHCHKDFSNVNVADSGETIENYAKRTKYLKGKCLFSGEHGNQGNHFHVYNVANNNDLKYRHSSEVYWVKDRLEKDNTNAHMIIVAKNMEGREDLNYILSMANIDGYYYRPRIDLDLLLGVKKDNFIITSACIAGWDFIGRDGKLHGYPDAEDIWLRIADHFQENFFFEIQANHTDQQRILNERILKLSDKYGISIIAGLDSHYIGNIGEVKRNQILKYKNVHYPDEEGWFMDYPDSATLIKRILDQGVLNEEQALTALMNTNVFVNGCEEIVLNRDFKIPTLYPDKTYEEKVRIFKKEINNAYMKESYKSKEKVDGIRYEVGEIIDSGVVDYFLTTKGIIEESINHQGGVLTTTSRGSSSSYITNKLLGITTIDRYTSEVPIYPERFLTKDRVLSGSMPDIDNNLPDQEPFVKASKVLLGEHGCYPLMAVEKLKTKAAWQLYAGANNVTPTEANEVSRYIEEYEKKLKHASDDERDSIQVEEFIPTKYAELFKNSNEYRGITINLKVHACGYMLFNGDIRREVGLISAFSQTTKKRTLCACIEGKFLDDFGYVKEDYLIVDSVGLTYEFFQSINKPVPTFDELKQMVDGDKATWDIYANGITCCVNQCEKKETTQKVMKYKPKNIAELSAFIAGIRPAFSSLLSNFLERKEYSTGEPAIDEVLEDTYHYMIYQESIMKVLSFLGLQMGETYTVIKNISKKKYLQHPEKLIVLKDKLKEVWENKIGNLDNFDKVWKIVEDASAYAFNSPHAYSMAGDSLYQAWFKAHYTKEFYEVAINHYQKKNKKDKIDDLVKEATTYFGYKLGEYKFGNDNRTVSIDEETKTIYPNLSSIKGFGEGVAIILYDVGQNKPESFVEVLHSLNGINKIIISKLIRIEYFSMYGDVNTLLKIVEYDNLLYGKKEISKKKAEENNIPIELLQKYGHETDKKFNKLDINSVFNELVMSIKPRPLTTEEILKNQLEILGICTYVDTKYSKRKYLVLEVESKKMITNVKLYEIYSGKIRTTKMWTSNFIKNEFDEGDIIYIYTIEPKLKKEPTGEINPKTGKRIYKNTDEFEYWLKSYYVTGGDDYN